MRRASVVRIGLIKPVKALVVGRTVRATDKAWREAIFGIGRMKKRLGCMRLGTIDGQPMSLICELQVHVDVAKQPGGQPWVIHAEDRSYALVGPAAVYNDAGFGPASIGISIDKLRAMVDFDPSPEVFEKALIQPKDEEGQGNAGRKPL